MSEKINKSEEVKNGNAVAGVTKKQYAAAILLVILESFGFSLMSMFVKLAGDLPVMEKAFFRNAVAAVVALIMLIRRPPERGSFKKNIPDLFFRCFFGCIGLILNFWAIDHMVLADANILNKMSPFFAMLASIFILKEIPSKFQWAVTALAFAGVLFIVKPTSGVASLPALAGLIGGLGAGVAYTYVRKLGKNGLRGPAIVFSFSLFSMLATLPFFIFSFEPMTTSQLLCLLGAGGGATIGQFCVTKAYALVPARYISVFDYSQVIFAGMWGMVIFGEYPDWLSIVGGAIIIVAAVLMWRYNRDRG